MGETYLICIIILFLFLALLGLCCYVGFSLVVVSGGYSLVVVCGVLTVGLLWQSTGSRACGLR